MTQLAIRRANARWHMNEARLALADAAADSASTYLEYAIACLDLVVEGMLDMGRSGEPFAVAPRDPVMVRAMGGALSIIGTVLARKDVVPLDELGQLLGIFATVSAEDDPACGTIIAAWGGMMIDAARSIGMADGD